MVRADRRCERGGPCGDERHALDPDLREQPRELILHHVGERARDDQRRRAGRILRQFGDDAGEARILALRERGLDPAARIIEHPRPAGMLCRQPQRGARQVELDDFGRAGADEEQQFYLGSPLQQPVHHAVELLVRVRQSGKVALADDRGRETWLGEDHDARRRLDQVRARAAADDEEKRVLDLAMEPDDPGQPAEHRALARIAEGGHPAHAAIGPDWRASRNFRTYCAALMQ